MSKFLKIKSSPNEYVVSPDDILSISEDSVSGGIKILTKTSSATIASSTIGEFVKESKDKIKDLNAGSQSVFLDVNLEQGGISVEEISGGLESVQAGDNILIDATDPKNPIITAEGGIEGTNYLFVAADGTDVENASSLQAAYDEAKTLSPSATNRITIIAANGYYNFGTDAFVMDTQFIDLVSLDGNRSVIFNSANANGTISITQNFIYVKGVDVLTKNFLIGSGFGSLRIENCKGGDFSFGGDNTFGSNPLFINGTFINCQGGNNSFGGTGTASGTFTNCVGAQGSFGGFGTASGTFTNCIGGVSSFGGSGTASGTFTNCQGGNVSFGAFGTASGTFTNCQGGNRSFAGGFNSTLSGKLYRCQLTDGTFITPTGLGKVVLGIDGNDDVINL